MNRRCLLVAIACTFILPTGSETRADELMSPNAARRMGLEEAWQRQIRVPAGAASIVHQELIVHGDRAKEFVEIQGTAAEGKAAPVLFRLDINTPGATGAPIGKAEAERLARRELRRLKRFGGDPKITFRTVPRVNLYTAANNGTVECRDAETGAPLWMTQVGDARLGYGKMGVDDKYLTLTNGANLILIDVTNGEPVSNERMLSIPIYGAIHAGGYSILPTIRNGIECYPLVHTKETPFMDDVPFMEIVSGLALKPPTKSPSSAKIAWGTDRDFVYVMETSGEPSVLFRLHTDGIVSGRIAAGAGDRFFFGSESGQVYALKGTRSGRVIWSQPYGEPFYKDPILVDGVLMIPSEYGNLFALDENTGISVWSTPMPNVDKVVGGLEGKVFVRLISGGFAAIDVKTGQMLDIDRALMPRKLLVNRVTNRLYLVDSIGTVQCLRPIGAEMPSLQQSQEAFTETPKETKPKKVDNKKKADPFKTDPFGAGNDPFGAGGAAGGNDPFGNAGGMPADDPFGTPPAGDAKDPFGGSPF
ncbi:MAG: PQQ-binding-like beta-propeller repeat protein [Planctomycetota bacterium]